MDVILGRFPLLVKRLPTAHNVWCLRTKNHRDNEGQGFLKVENNGATATKLATRLATRNVNDLQYLTIVESVMLFG